MDLALEAVPGAFYARYGDDFLFAHPQAEVAREAAAIMDEKLDALWLTVNEKKRRTLFLTPAGRPAGDWPDATGSSSVPFLGTRIDGKGTVGLDETKVRSLLRELGRRTEATARTLRHAERDRVGRAVCAVVNQALEPTNALTQQRSAVLLRRVVTDRHQLEQLDYQIARIVLRAVSGRRQAAVFREIPYRRLRREWGLVSLVAARNARAHTSSRVAA
jgi:hypothetical protein